MNERRSELVDEIQKLVEGAFNTGRGFSMMEPPFDLEESMARERANELIALVTAARDAEIREALLSDGAVDKYVASVKTAMDIEEPEPTDEDSARLAARFWLDAIGLAEGGAE